MGISTSTGTLIAGQSRTFNLSPASAVTLTLSPNVRVTITETPATVAATGLGGNASRVHNPLLSGTFTYGPYAMGGVVVVAVASNSGSSVGWVRSDSIVAESADGSSSLVDGAGNPFGIYPTVNNFGSRVPSAKVTSSAAPANATHHLATVAEAPFSAVRILTYNNLAATVGISSGVVAASANLTSKHTPSGGSSTWVPITWAGASSVSLPACIGVDRPSITYSDWIPVSSLPRDDGGALPIIFARVFIPTATANFSINYMNITNEVRSDGRIIYSRNQSGDFTLANPGGFADVNQRNSSPIHGIEYLAQGKLTTVAGMGDSITQGGNNPWIQIACALASTPERPVVSSNWGWNGQTTAQFYDRFIDYIASGARPSILIYSPFSPNDGTPTVARMDADMARAVTLLDLCARNNIKVILTTPCPNTSLAWAAVDDAYRLQLRDRLLAMRSMGVTVADFEPVLSNGAVPARFIPALTSDGLHPNDGFGNPAIGAMMGPIIAAMKQ